MNRKWSTFIKYIVGVIIGLNCIACSSMSGRDHNEKIIQPPIQDNLSSGDKSEVEYKNQTEVAEPSLSLENEAEQELQAVIDASTSSDEIISAPKDIRGVYISASRFSSSEKVDTLIQQFIDTQVNAVVIDVKNDFGNVTFDAKGTCASKIGATTSQIYDISEVLERLHDQNIYVIGRVVAFRDSMFAKKYPKYALNNLDGTPFVDRAGDHWLNPYNEKCRTYVMEIAEYAAKIGFDEIQFDYVRFSTEADQQSVSFGRSAENKNKTEIITEFIKEAVKTLHAVNCTVSADVFGTIINSKIDSEIVGQSYVELSRYLDYISPMIYPSHYGNGCYGIGVPDLEPYALITCVLSDSVISLQKIDPKEHCAIVRPWLQDFTASWLKEYQKYGSKQVQEQIQGVYDSGYNQWLLWNSSGKYSTDALKKEK